MVPEAPSQLGGCLGVAGHALVECFEPAREGRSGIGRRDNPGIAAVLAQAGGSLGIARDGRADQRGMVPGQELRCRVEDDVGALVERVEIDGGRDGRIADDEAGVPAKRRDA